MAQPDVEEVALRTGVTADMAALVLGEGELGGDLTTKELKLGDGVTAFADLGSLTPVLVTATLVGGAVTITDAKIKATSKVAVITKTLGTVTVASAFRKTVNAGVSYTLTASQATDTSVIEVLVWH